jgi:7-cyano-7-deazaguanine synthase in queuosine biosynthesis
LGHRYEKFEKDWINELVPNTLFDHTIKLGQWEHEDAFIPLRNLFLVSVAALYSNDIILTVQKGELTLADRSPLFMLESGRLLGYLKDKIVSVDSPFVNMTKTQMVTWYLGAGNKEEDLHKTRSCYSTEYLPCGRCTACFRRWVAFTNNGITETFKHNILDYEEIPHYLQRIKDGYYDEVRAEETIRALKLGGYKF